MKILVVIGTQGSDGPPKRRKKNGCFSMNMPLTRQVWCALSNHCIAATYPFPERVPYPPYRSKLEELEQNMHLTFHGVVRRL